MKTKKRFDSLVFILIVFVSLFLSSKSVFSKDSGCKSFSQVREKLKIEKKNSIEPLSDSALYDPESDLCMFPVSVRKDSRLHRIIYQKDLKYFIKGSVLDSSTLIDRFDLIESDLVKITDHEIEEIFRLLKEARIPLRGQKIDKEKPNDAEFVIFVDTFSANRRVLLNYLQRLSREIDRSFYVVEWPLNPFMLKKSLSKNYCERIDDLFQESRNCSSRIRSDSRILDVLSIVSKRLIKSKKYFLQKRPIFVFRKQKRVFLDYIPLRRINYFL